MKGTDYYKTLDIFAHVNRNDIAGKYTPPPGVSADTAALCKTILLAAATICDVLLAIEDNNAQRI